MIEPNFTHWTDFYDKPQVYFDKLAQALGVDLLSLKRKAKHPGFVMEGGVVEADRAVIEGIAVNAQEPEAGVETDT